MDIIELISVKQNRVIKYSSYLHPCKEIFMLGYAYGFNPYEDEKIAGPIVESITAEDGFYCLNMEDNSVYKLPMQEYIAHYADLTNISVGSKELRDLLFNTTSDYVNEN